VWLKNVSADESSEGWIHAGKFGDGVNMVAPPTWFQFADDFGASPGAYDNQVAFNLGPNEGKHIWIKLTVPATSTPTQKVDLTVSAYIL
jgi:hypothetical protein